VTREYFRRADWRRVSRTLGAANKSTRGMVADIYAIMGGMN